MRRRWLSPVLAAAVLAAVLLAAAAGCGGGEDAEPELYRLEPTRACLRAADVRTSEEKLDVVALTALGGALHARFPGNEVTLSFGESNEDAEQLVRAYRRFASRKVRLGDVLRRERNVVLLWGIAPAPEHAQTVSGCLRA